MKCSHKCSHRNARTRLRRRSRLTKPTRTRTRPRRIARELRVGSWQRSVPPRRRMCCEGTAGCWVLACGMDFDALGYGLSCSWVALVAEATFGDYETVISFKLSIL